MDYKTHFTNIYTNKIWGGNGATPLSGPGSSLSGTTQIRSALDKICDKYNIQSIADLGCGDLTWMSTLEIFNTKKYTGVDVVDVLIQKHKQKYPNHTFLCLDLIYDELPDADLAIVRDVSFHLPNKDVLTLIEKLKKYKYVAITSNNINKNQDLSGRYTPRNLRIQPFNLKPIETIPEPQWNREVLILNHF